MTEPDAPVQPDVPFVEPAPEVPAAPVEPVDVPEETPAPMRIDEDRIYMASRNSDGTIAEKNPIFIGPLENAIKGAAHQLKHIFGLSDDEAYERAKAEVTPLHESNVDR